jgi:hypothetical protein
MVGQAPRDARNKGNVRRMLSSRFDKWTHRRILAHVKDCLGGLVSGGGDGDCSDLFSVDSTVSDDDAAGGPVSRGFVSVAETRRVPLFYPRKRQCRK